MLSKIKALKANKYFKNSSWLVLEKVFRLIIGFFISIWVVRYLEPKNFGLLSYIQSILAIVAVFVTLGLDGIVLREIVKKGVDKHRIISTSFIMSFIVSLAIVLLIYFLKEFISNDSQKWILFFILSFTLIFQSTNILDVYFQEKVLSKYTVFSGVISLIVGSILKIILIMGNYELIYFIIAIVIEKALYSLSMVYFYKLKEGNISLNFDKEQAKYLLSNSWPLIFSALSYIVYTRTDQIMIEHFLGSYEVGIYSAAVRLYEMPFMLTTIISSTFTPMLYKKYNENPEEFFKLTLKILSYTTLVAYIIVLFFLLFSTNIVTILYGEKYIESAKVLMILGFILIIQFNSFMRSGFLVLINKQKLFFYLGVLFVFINITLNAILISNIGLMGAIYATLIVRITTLFAYYFFKETRVYFYTQIRSILLLGLI